MSGGGGPVSGGHRADLLVIALHRVSCALPVHMELGQDVVGDHSSHSCLWAVMTGCGRVCGGDRLWVWEGQGVVRVCEKERSVSK